jgi:hypothetical protein
MESNRGENLMNRTTYEACTINFKPTDALRRAWEMERQGDATVKFLRVDEDRDNAGIPQRWGVYQVTLKSYERPVVSKKLQQLKAGGPTLYYRTGDRYYSVWYDFELQCWYMDWGTQGLGADDKEHYDTFAETEQAMRDLADLRHWVYGPSF